MGWEVSTDVGGGLGLWPSQGSPRTAWYLLPETWCCWRLPARFWHGQDGRWMWPQESWQPRARTGARGRRCLCACSSCALGSARGRAKAGHEGPAPRHRAAPAQPPLCPECLPAPPSHKAPAPPPQEASSTFLPAPAPPDVPILPTGWHVAGHRHQQVHGVKPAACRGGRQFQSNTPVSFKSISF